MMSFMGDDCGLRCNPIGVDAGDLFDHIDDLLDFPGSGEDVLGNGMGIVGVDGPPDLSAFPPLPLHADNGSLLSAAGSDLSGHVEVGIVDGLAFTNDEPKLGPCDELDMVQLEWMSNFFDESNDASSFHLFHNANAAAAADDNDSKNAMKANANANANAVIIDGNEEEEEEDTCFRTPSPKSVLLGGGAAAAFPSSSSTSTSSSSSSSYSSSGVVMNNERRVLATLRVHGRPRSKRPRPRAAITFVPPPASEPASQLSGSDESCPPPSPSKKKKKTKQPPPQQFHLSDDGEEHSGSPPMPAAVRKCMHCEITKTPQWRAGPMGPKTLCNACGVRYKSGRLFPEYRPAASPTFVSSIHSNSHKKVVEMRLKSTQKPNAAVAQRTSSCDLLEYLRRRG